MQSLQDYRISPVTGCLLLKPTPPPQALLPYYNLMKISHDLYNNGKFREEVMKLPKLDLDGVKTFEDKILAHKVLVHLAIAYIHENMHKDPKKIIPAHLAVPMMQLSLDLGYQPLPTYTDIFLANCFPEKHHYLKRRTFYIECLVDSNPHWHTFLDVFADIEMTFAEGVKIIMHIVDAVNRGDINTTAECVSYYGNIISIMREKGNVLLDELDPEIFYLQLRPFLITWPKGMIYEGVPNNVLTGAEPDDLSGEIPALRHYLGASASQTISTQSMDSLLGIKHSPGVRGYIVNGRKYMIREHRTFMEDLEKHLDLRKFVQESGSVELTKAYNSCVRELIDFRKDHLNIVEKMLMEPHVIHGGEEESIEKINAENEAIRSLFNLMTAETEAALIKE